MPLSPFTGQRDPDLSPDHKVHSSLGSAWEPTFLLDHRAFAAAARGPGAAPAAALPTPSWGRPPLEAAAPSAHRDPLAAASFGLSCVAPPSQPSSQQQSSQDPSTAPQPRPFGAPSGRASGPPTAWLGGLSQVPCPSAAHALPSPGRDEDRPRTPARPSPSVEPSLHLLDEMSTIRPDMGPCMAAAASTAAPLGGYAGVDAQPSFMFRPTGLPLAPRALNRHPSTGSRGSAGSCDGAACGAPSAAPEPSAGPRCSHYAPRRVRGPAMDDAAVSFLARPDVDGPRPKTAPASSTVPSAAPSAAPQGVRAFGVLGAASSTDQQGTTSTAASSVTDGAAAHAALESESLLPSFLPSIGGVSCIAPAPPSVVLPSTAALSTAPFPLQRPSTGGGGGGSAPTSRRSSVGFSGVDDAPRSSRDGLSSLGHAMGRGEGSAGSREERTTAELRTSREEQLMAELEAEGRMARSRRRSVRLHGEFDDPSAPTTPLLTPSSSAPGTPLFAPAQAIAAPPPLAAAGAFAVDHGPFHAALVGSAPPTPTTPSVPRPWGEPFPQALALGGPLQHPSAAPSATASTASSVGFGTACSSLATSRAASPVSTAAASSTAAPIAPSLGGSFGTAAMAAGTAVASTAAVVGGGGAGKRRVEHSDLCDAAFDFVGDLGSGGSAVRVEHAVLRRHAMHVALKRIPLLAAADSRHAKALQAEVNVHRRLRHANIVRLFSYYKSGACVVLVLELCEGGTLLQRLRDSPGQRLSCAEAVPIVRQLCAGLQYLHGQGVAHRDVKLENVFVTTDGCVKLGDFGWAHKVRGPPAKASPAFAVTGADGGHSGAGGCGSDEDGEHGSEQRARRTCVGTLDYLSPEMLCGAPHDTKTDVWSLGAAVVELLTGRPPFYHASEFHTVEAIKTQPPRLPTETEHGVPDGAAALLASMLRKDPAARPTVAEVLQHPWLAQP